MLPDAAVLQSPEKGSLDIKLCGLYALERNIILLHRAGITQIYVDLTEPEIAFYRNNIKKHLGAISRTVKEEPLPSSKKTEAIYLSANCFFQAHHLLQADIFFTRKKNGLYPIYDGNIFEITSPADAARAEDVLVQTIRDNTPGLIARHINKSISLPISRVLSKTRIHPNVLTVLNMIVGFSSAFFLSMNTYASIALGGLCFQLASIFDGVDGEVAKLTLKVSKLGGWLDTISDNGTLILFFSASSYLFFLNSTTILMPLAAIGFLFAGLFTMLAAMISFLRKHTSSGSLVTYDKEFLQKLPDTDRLVSFIHKLKYYTKKEFFSLAFFAVCLTGKIHYIVPAGAFFLSVAAIMLLVLNHRYRSFNISHS